VIVLDTNVVSELVKPGPSPRVISWVDGHDSTDLVITALTAAEVRAGVALLPGGRRKREIGRLMETLLTDTFAARTSAGRTISAVAAQIAAISRQHQATLATRNTADFTGTGIELINPWDA